MVRDAHHLLGLVVCRTRYCIQVVALPIYCAIPTRSYTPVLVQSVCLENCSLSSRRLQDLRYQEIRIEENLCFGLQVSIILVLQRGLNERQVIETLIGVVELAIGLAWYFLVALELVWLEHVLPIFHNNVLLFLLVILFISGGGPFLWADSGIQFIVRYGHLIGYYLVLAACYWVLTTRDEVHVNFVDIRLILQILFWARLHSASTILLAKVQAIFSRYIGWTSRPHLILRSVPCLLHVWFYEYLRLTYIGSLLIGVGVVAADHNLVVSFNLVVDASRELVRLVHAVCQGLLLQVAVYLATSPVSCQATSSRRLALPVRVCILARRRFLSQKYLLCVVFEEVHASVWSSAILLVPDKVLRLLYQLVIIRPPWSRPIILLSHDVKVVSLVPVPIRVQVLIIGLAFAPWIAIILYVDIIINIVWMGVAIMAGMDGLLVVLLDDHLVIVLTAFPRIAVPLLWCIVRTQIISYACRHQIVAGMIRSPACYKW